MSKPVLNIFRISHYCEKARWALDYLNVDYELRTLPVIEHIKIARAAGAAGSGTPFLTGDDVVVQGSSAIIDWADAAATGDQRLTPEDDSEQCMEIERRLDDIAGVHVRRYFYSEAVVDHSKTVRAVFTTDIPLKNKIIVSLAWSKIRGKMMKFMDLGPSQRIDSRAKVEAELDWLDDLLSDGREYLTGSKFTRADLTAASLLAPLTLPEQHPLHSTIQLPPVMTSEVAEWQNRPSLKLVRRVYEQYR
jgi:glutathione S-transferase